GRISAPHYSLSYNTTSTTRPHTLSLHDALPISRRGPRHGGGLLPADAAGHPGPAVHLRRAEGHPGGRRLHPGGGDGDRRASLDRSEEHTSELQSRSDLVCRLLLEKKKEQEARLA